MLINFSRSYLTDRISEVKSNGRLSVPMKISAGHPTISILGPIIYLIYTSVMFFSDATQTSTFANEAALVSIHKNPVVSSEQLPTHIRISESCYKNRKYQFSYSYIFNSPISQKEHVNQRRVYLDRRITRSHYINAKITQIKLRCQQMDWLKGLRSPLDLKDNVVLYKTCIKPIWMFGMELWDTVSASNISTLQGRQSNSLRLISDAS